MSKLPDLQGALRALEGVTHASIRWPEPGGPATLRVEFAPDADRGTMTERVLSVIQDVGGADLATLAVRPPRDTNGHLRPIFSGLVVDRGNLETSVEVTLTYGDREAKGRADGLATRQYTPRTAAAAALTALRQFLPPEVRVQLDWLEVVDDTASGRPRVVQSAVTCLTHSGEETFVGSAFARGDLREAAVRATLDAVNRRVARLLV